MREKFKEVQIPLHIHTPDQRSPEQDRFEEIQRERGIRSPNWQESRDIMEQVNRERNGGRGTDRSYDF